MQKFIALVNTAINPVKYITGSCAAYAAFLCEEAERRKLSWDLVILSRTDTIANDGSMMVSHVMAQIDGKYYDVTGETGVDEWIADINKDLESYCDREIEWKHDVWGGGWPSLVLKEISNQYRFDHDQLTAFSELKRATEDLINVKVP